MTDTDRILISRDKYLHLGLCASRNHFSGLLMNELVPVEETFLESKKNLMAYIDDRIDQHDALRLLRNASNNYENIRVISLKGESRCCLSGLEEITLSEYEQQCQLRKDNQFKKNAEKYAKFHREYNVKLTRTEREIMLLILKEMGVMEMAEALNCSKKVIYTHRYNIIKKYGFRSFNELYVNILQQEQE